MENNKIIEELKLQIEDCDTKLETEKCNSKYVEILSKKRELVELLKKEQKNG